MRWMALLALLLLLCEAREGVVVFDDEGDFEDEGRIDDATLQRLREQRQQQQRRQPPPPPAPAKPTVPLQTEPPAPTAPARQLAIVTTTWRPEMFTEWIGYHLAVVGVSHIYVICDDEDDAGPFSCREHAGGFDPSYVTVIVHDSAWRARVQRAKTPRAPLYTKTYDSEVMSRQCLNAQTVAEMLTAEAVAGRWLLHIDTDEMVVLPGDAQSIADVLLALPDSADVISLRNYEVVADPPVTDHCFTTQRYFATRPQRMVAYVNGKSAARVDLPTAPVEKGVHEWFSRKGYSTANAAESSIALLHYVSCGMYQWVRKYVRLGPFGDKWFGTAPVSGNFHLQSRDHIGRCIPGDMPESEWATLPCWKTLENFFKSQRSSKADARRIDIVADAMRDPSLWGRFRRRP